MKVRSGFWSLPQPSLSTHVDIYRPARLDPAAPIAEAVGAIADLVMAGYVRFIGLSEVGSDTIRKAAVGDRYPTPLMAHLDSERG
jgi:aryl-alcohol dehydrogenase-like predicted oxidoreductase